MDLFYAKVVFFYNKIFSIIYNAETIRTCNESI